MPAPARSGNRIDAESADSEATLHAARSGSVEAIGRLFESVRGHLILSARRGLPRRFRTRLGASDVVQDAFTVGQRQFESFRGGSQAEFFGWMRTILSRTMIDRVRSEASARRMPARAVLDLSAVESSDGAFADAPVDRPLASVIRAEDASLVSSAIDSLPPDQRRVIWLRHWMGMTFSEIGADLGRTEDAARKLWCRAFERLEREIRRRSGGDSDRESTPRG